MSQSRKPVSEIRVDALSDRFRSSLNYEESNDNDVNKPDFRELDLGSPISPLRTRRSGIPSQAASSSSTTSSSSGSATERNGSCPAPTRSGAGGNNYSGELSGSVDSPPTLRGSKQGQVVNDSIGSHPSMYMGGSSATSPALNVLPTGNICPSGKILKTGMASRPSRTDVLGLGTGNYGHGSIMRGGVALRSCGANDSGIGGSPNPRGSTTGETAKRGMLGNDPEEVKKAGNEQYKRGNFAEALSLYDKAIAMSPSNAAYHCNRAAALIGLKRLVEAIKECEHAIRLDPGYVRAHHRLGSLFLSLGQVENARRHLFFPGQRPDPIDLQKLQAVEKHMNKCADSRKVSDWRSVLREIDAAIISGADASPQLFACRAEAHLKLHQLVDADFSLSNIPKFEASFSTNPPAKSFGMLIEAYLFFVQAQVELAFGRFDNALTAAERAAQIEPRNIEVSVLLSNVRLVGRARARGNDLFKSERFTEACSAYSEGLRLDPSNSVLYCNRAACWYKLCLWERSVGDCSQALHIQPNYMKALLRRASSYSKLERWAEAVKDYEVLSRELPLDKEVHESFFHAQIALRKSRGEEVYNMKFGGEVELVSGLEQFRAAVSSSGTSVVHFKTASDLQCKHLSPFLDSLCSRYPSVNFLKVDIEESPAIANAEDVRIVPTFKIYKKGSRLKEMVCPSPEVLESSVRHYSF